MAQAPVVISYPDSASLSVNGTLLNSNINIEALTKLLGARSNIVDYPNGDKSYFYETTGFVLMVADAKIKGVAINFNWDGDKKFPQTSFSGQLKMGELSVTKATTQPDISAIKKVEFGCPMDMLCASKGRTAKIRCTAAFVNNEVSQVGFLLK